MFFLEGAFPHYSCSRVCSDVYANIQVHVSSISLYFNENLEYTIYSILLLVVKTGIRIKIGPLLTQARTRQENA